MDDIIYRQAAIDGLNKIPDLGVYEYCSFLYMLRSMPSAQPEQKKGKWIVYYECPKCGEITKDFTEHCPFCNADMRGEKDG